MSQRLANDARLQARPIDFNIRQLGHHGAYLECGGSTPLSFFCLVVFWLCFCRIGGGSKIRETKERKRCRATALQSGRRMGLPGRPTESNAVSAPPIID